MERAVGACRNLNPGSWGVAPGCDGIGALPLVRDRYKANFAAHSDPEARSAFFACLKAEPRSPTYTDIGAHASDKSMQKLKDTVGELLHHRQSGPWPEIRDRLNRTLPAVSGCVRVCQSGGTISITAVCARATKRSTTLSAPKCAPRAALAARLTQMTCKDVTNYPRGVAVNSVTVSFLTTTAYGR